jgi:hypothetical protein
MPKITKRLIDALRPNQGDQKDLFAWDSELRGFGVRMKPSGSASYVVQYRTHKGRPGVMLSPKLERSRPIKRGQKQSSCLPRLRPAPTRQRNAMRNVKL